MKHRLSLNAGRLANELAGLPTLERKELIDKWRILYGTEPPGGVRNNFLMHAIAHCMQKQAFGGLKSGTRRFLEKAAEGNVSKRQTVGITSTKPGTRLL